MGDTTPLDALLARSATWGAKKKPELPANWNVERQVPLGVRPRQLPPRPYPVLPNDEVEPFPEDDRKPQTIEDLLIEARSLQDNTGKLEAEFKRAESDLKSERPGYWERPGLDLLPDSFPDAAQRVFGQGAKMGYDAISTPVFGLRDVARGLAEKWSEPKLPRDVSPMEAALASPNFGLTGDAATPESINRQEAEGRGFLAGAVQPAVEQTTPMALALTMGGPLRSLAGMKSVRAFGPLSQGVQMVGDAVNAAKIIAEPILAGQGAMMVKDAISPEPGRESMFQPGQAPGMGERLWEGLQGGAMGILSLLGMATGGRQPVLPNRARAQKLATYGEAALDRNAPGVVSGESPAAGKTLGGPKPPGWKPLAWQPMAGETMPQAAKDFKPREVVNLQKKATVAATTLAAKGGKPRNMSPEQKLLWDEYETLEKRRSELEAQADALSTGEAPDYKQVAALDAEIKAIEVEVAQKKKGLVFEAGTRPDGITGATQQPLVETLAPGEQPQPWTPPVRPDRPPEPPPSPVRPPAPPPPPPPPTNIRNFLNGPVGPSNPPPPPAAIVPPVQVAKGITQPGLPVGPEAVLPKRVYTKPEPEAPPPDKQADVSQDPNPTAEELANVAGLNSETIALIDWPTARRLFAQARARMMGMDPGERPAEPPVVEPPKPPVAPEAPTGGQGVIDGLAADRLREAQRGQPPPSGRESIIKEWMAKGMSREEAEARLNGTFTPPPAEPVPVPVPQAPKPLAPSAAAVTPEPPRSVQTPARAPAGVAPDPKPDPVVNPAGGLMPDPNAYIVPDPTVLNLDPALYQHKKSGKGGVTGTLAGITEWEAFSPPLLVHEQANGKLFVANGHQRYNRYMELRAEGKQLPPLRVRIMREVDGVDVATVRRMAAEQNIVEGTATPMDVAKLLREAPLSAKQRGKIAKGERSGLILNTAEGLKGLSEEAFLTIDEIGADPHGVASVAKYFTDPKQQIAAIQAIAKKGIDNYLDGEAYTRKLKSNLVARTEKGAQGDLFGNAEFEDITYVESQLERTFGKTLASRLSAVKNALKNKQFLEESGTATVSEGGKTVKGDLSGLKNLYAKYKDAAGSATNNAIRKMAGELYAKRVTDSAAADYISDALRRDIDTGGYGDGKPAANAPVQPGPGGRGDGQPRTSDAVVPPAKAEPTATVEEAQEILRQGAAALNQEAPPLAGKPPLTLVTDKATEGMPPPTKAELEASGQTDMFAEPAKPRTVADILAATRKATPPKEGRPIDPRVGSRSLSELLDDQRAARAPKTKTPREEVFGAEFADTKPGTPVRWIDDDGVVREGVIEPTTQRMRGPRGEDLLAGKVQVRYEQDGKTIHSMQAETSLKEAAKAPTPPAKPTTVTEMVKPPAPPPIPEVEAERPAVAKAVEPAVQRKNEIKAGGKYRDAPEDEYVRMVRARNQAMDSASQRGQNFVVRIAEVKAGAEKAYEQGGVEAVERYWADIKAKIDATPVKVKDWTPPERIGPVAELIAPPAKDFVIVRLERRATAQESADLTAAGFRYDSKTSQWIGNTDAPTNRKGRPREDLIADAKRIMGEKGPKETEGEFYGSEPEPEAPKPPPVAAAAEPPVAENPLVKARREFAEKYGWKVMPDGTVMRDDQVVAEGHKPWEPRVEGPEIPNEVWEYSTANTRDSAADLNRQQQILERKATEAEAKTPLLGADPRIETGPEAARAKLKEQDESNARWLERMRQHGRDTADTANYWRAKVKELVSPEEFAFIEERRAQNGVNDPSTGADIWHNQYRRLMGENGPGPSWRRPDYIEIPMTREVQDYLQRGYADQVETYGYKGAQRSVKWSELRDKYALRRETEPKQAGLEMQPGEGTESAGLDRIRQIFTPGHMGGKASPAQADAVLQALRESKLRPNPDETSWISQGQINIAMRRMAEGKPTSWDAAIRNVANRIDDIVPLEKPAAPAPETPKAPSLLDEPYKEYTPEQRMAKGQEIAKSGKTAEELKVEADRLDAEFQDWMGKEFDAGRPLRGTPEFNRRADAVVVAKLGAEWKAQAEAEAARPKEFTVTTDKDGTVTTVRTSQQGKGKTGVIVSVRKKGEIDTPGEQTVVIDEIQRQTSAAIEKLPEPAAPTTVSELVEKPKTTYEQLNNRKKSYLKYQAKLTEADINEMTVEEANKYGDDHGIRVRAEKVEREQGEKRAAIGLPRTEPIMDVLNNAPLEPKVKQWANGITRMARGESLVDLSKYTEAQRNDPDFIRSEVAKEYGDFFADRYASVEAGRRIMQAVVGGRSSKKLLTEADPLYDQTAAEFKGKEGVNPVPDAEAARIYRDAMELRERAKQDPGFLKYTEERVAKMKAGEKRAEAYEAPFPDVEIRPGQAEQARLERYRAALLEKGTPESLDAYAESFGELQAREHAIITGQMHSESKVQPPPRGPNGDFLGGSMFGPLEGLIDLYKTDNGKFWNVVRATGIMGSTATGYYKDEDHPFRGAVLGFMAGVSLASATGAGRAQMGKWAGATGALGGKAKGTGIEAYTGKEIRKEANENRDLTWFEAAMPTSTETVARTAYERATKTMSRLNNEMAFGTLAEQPLEVRKRVAGAYVKQAVGELRSLAKEYKAQGFVKKAMYVNEMADALAKKPTKWQMGVKDTAASFGKDITYDFIERHVGTNTYRMLTGYAMDSFMQNVTQPILATRHVSLGDLAFGYRLARTEWGRKMTAHTKINRPVDMAEDFAGITSIEGVEQMTGLKGWAADAQRLMAVSDNWNRRVVYLAAMRAAMRRGLMGDYAREWSRAVETQTFTEAYRTEANDYAMRVMRDTQGDVGPLAMNPKFRGPLGGSLRPFLKYPTLLMRNMGDVFFQPDKRGRNRFVTTVATAVMLGKQLGFDLEDTLVMGGKPYGLGLSDPESSVSKLMSGDIFPAVKAAKDVSGHVSEWAGGEPMKHAAVPTNRADVLGSDLAYWLFGRYPMKVAGVINRTIESDIKPLLAGKERTAHRVRTASGALNPTSLGEDLASLTGFKRTRVAGMADVVSDAAKQQFKDTATRRARQAVLKREITWAEDHGDTERAGQLYQEYLQLTRSVESIKALKRGLNNTQFDRLYNQGSPTVKKMLNEQFRPRVEENKLQ